MIILADGNFGFSYASKDYTEEEIGKFKSDNYCLRTLYKELRPASITKETCFNSQLATTGNSGISCGYYEMKLYFNDNTEGDFKGCYLFNDDTLKNKNVGFLFKKNSEDYSTMAADEAKKEVSHYKITMTNKEGKYFSYNSLDDTVTTDSAKFLHFKFIILLVLILI